MNHTGIQADKRLLRKEIRLALSSLSETERQAQSALLCKHLETLASWMSARRVLGYWPMALEPDLRPAIERAALRGTEVFLPIVRDGSPRMWPGRYQGRQRLVNGRFGILEPPQPVSELPNFDIVLVPAVGVTEGGLRLGHGGGYYDEFLAQLPDRVRTIAPVLAVQVIPHTPTEPHDLPVHCVITPSGVIPSDTCA